MADEKHKSPYFEGFLRVKVAFKGKQFADGSLSGLSASGDYIAIRSNKCKEAGEHVTISLPVPAHVETIVCEGIVEECKKTDNIYEMEISISDIDDSSKEHLRRFCNFLIPHSGSEIIDYLIQQGEESLKEAGEVTIGDGVGERLESLMHELLSLKYHDALRSFEDALKMDMNNEAAIEGFCYSLAKAVSHYHQAGLDGLADTIKIKAMHYYNEKTLEVANNSPRINQVLMLIIRGIFPCE
ncbi:hypothetical protein GF312_04050 [Candidatus Poribacteria bacterium]|nr:hypothetical protein [Candidatus Poribacteria bacterium]